MSDEISDIVDMGQFYDDAKEDNLYIRISAADGDISGKVSSIKIADNSTKISFLSDVITSSRFVFSNIKSIQLSLNNETEIREYNSFSVSSKSFKPNKNNRYECELIVQTFNI